MITSRNLPTNYSDTAPIYLYGEPLPRGSQQRHLGTIISADLRWSHHISHILNKARRLLGVLKRLRSSLSQQGLLRFYKTYIRPILEYADIAWSGLPQCQADRLEHFQLRAARIILSKPLFSHTSHSHLLFLLNLPTLSSRRQYHLSILAFHIKNRTAPKHLLDVSFTHRTQPYSLRHAQTFNTPIPRTTLYLESPLFKSSTVFDTLPLSIQNAKSLTNFKKAASKFLLSTKCSCSSYPHFH